MNHDTQHAERPEHSRLDALLDLLADEVSERLRARSEAHLARAKASAPPPAQAAPVQVTPAREALPTAAQARPAEHSEHPGPGQPTPPGSPLAPPTPPTRAAPLMARLAAGVLVAVVLINIPLPFSPQGAALARSIPSSASLVIANGLLVKEEGSPDVYVYRDGAFHWISSLDVFERLGLRWQDVHGVPAGFLAQYPKGRALYVLWKCNESPHIYQLEAGTRHWIVDIPTFTERGFVWDDVQIVPCYVLRSIPDGDSIPPGRGTPPPPLP